MSRTLYLDCVGGLAGDMLLAALLDAGADAARLAALPARFGFSDVTISSEAVRRGGFAARHVDVRFDAAAHPHHRDPRQIAELIEGASLDEQVRARALSIFDELARAEAAVHDVAPERVHFHEVGAVDALIDVVGACELLASLGVEQLVCGPLPMGRGFVDCEHGRLPLPAPAVAEMLSGVPVRDAGVEGETVTPTGLAIVRGLGARFDAMPAMRVAALGIGAGSREVPGLPNVLRVFLGEVEDDAARAGTSTQVIVESTLDDLDPRLLPELFARLLDAGALDVHAAPVVTKKGRAAQLVRALAQAEAQEAVIKAFYRHSTTFGLRLYHVEKRALARRGEKVATPFGEAEVKVALEGDVALRGRAEYESCAALARRAGVSVLEVIAAAEAAWTARRPR